jgi:hypothetical protein
MNKMKLKDTIISSGGLFRCCIKTICELPEDFDFPDGTIIDCMFEKEGNKNIILRNGKWEWNNPNSEILKGK